MFLGKHSRQLKVGLRNALMDRGIDLYRRSADRRLLEKKILPHLATLPTCRRVLFIGCDWYTRGYRKFFAQQEYWTLDFDPDKQRFKPYKFPVTGSARVLIPIRSRYTYDF